MVDILLYYLFSTNLQRSEYWCNTKIYSYVYTGDQLSQMTITNASTEATESMRFTYDAEGYAQTINYQGTVYYYVTNVQGDVIGIIKGNGTQVVAYRYDAWGNVKEVSGSMSGTLGKANPLRYRGYVYDEETKLYYLESRYYDPEVGRFINADAFAATGQGFVGNNMFAYCLNNPVNLRDKVGESAEALQWWTSVMWWLCGADAFLPIGDIIYLGGMIFLGGVAIYTTQNNTLEYEWDENEEYEDDKASVADSDDDQEEYDDSYDDLYDDRTSVKGRQKIGKNKGNAPRNNKVQNAQFEDATRGLSKDIKRRIHDKISNQGYGYHDIKNFAKDYYRGK